MFVVSKTLFGCNSNYQIKLEPSSHIFRSTAFQAPSHPLTSLSHILFSLTTLFPKRSALFLLSHTKSEESRAAQACPHSPVTPHSHPHFPAPPSPLPPDPPNTLDDSPHPTRQLRGVWMLGGRGPAWYPSAAAKAARPLEAHTTSHLLLCLERRERQTDRDMRCRRAEGQPWAV
ncbi:hypothetical protein Ddc_18640 [Ditylenchus destructor]|nr:hypothetical protein Ddc_18640 [Ditylenchus destructor]